MEQLFSMCEEVPGSTLASAPLDNYIFIYVYHLALENVVTLEGTWYSEI